MHSGDASCVLRSFSRPMLCHHEEPQLPGALQSPDISGAHGDLLGS